MYLWQIEYNQNCIIIMAELVVNRFKLCIFDRLNTTRSDWNIYVSLLWIALNYVSLTDWIQLFSEIENKNVVVNRFKLCIFDRLNTTHYQLWFVFQYITTKFTIKNLYSILKSELKRLGLFWFYLVLFLSRIKL